MSDGNVMDLFGCFRLNDSELKVRELAERLLGEIEANAQKVYTGDPVDGVPQPSSEAEREVHVCFLLDRLNRAYQETPLSVSMLDFLSEIRACRSEDF